MTNKLTCQARRAITDERLEFFPDFPSRDDMQNFLNLYLQGSPMALIQHLGNPDTTLVMCEVPLYWYPSSLSRIPDLMVAFNIQDEAVVRRRGYSIEEQGKPPDFVLEVASPTTARNDYGRKRLDYAAFGISEYWRFDPTGGEWHDAALAGDRLVEGSYQSIDILRTDEGHLWGHSDVLNLDLCWEYGRLRWWGPATQRYLPTHEEEVEARRAAEARVRELEEELRRRGNP